MRTRNASINTGYTWHRSDVNGVYKLVNRYTGTGAMHFTETRSDRDLTPKATGWLYPKPYSLSVQKRHGPSGLAVTKTETFTYVPGPGGNNVMKWFTEFSRFEGSFGNAVDGGVVGFEILPSSSNEKNKAIIDALLQLKEQKINLGVAFAEAQQTADFCGDVFTAIARSVQLARQRKWKKSFRLLKQQYRRRVTTDPKGLTQDWLGWQYAAKPLIQDVNGAIRALQTRNVLPYWITTVKGISVRRERDNVVVSKQQWNSYSYQREQFRGYFVRLDYHPGNTFLSTLSSLGVTNPLEVIWEKVPFSFVIDWGVSVGDWLSSMDAAIGWQFLSGSCTERREVKMTFGKNMSPLNGGQKWVSQEIAGKHRWLELNRTVYTASPLPRAPVVKSPLSLSHMASALSLLVGILSGGTKSYVRQ